MKSHSMNHATRALGVLLLVVGIGGVAFGSVPPDVPELDPATGCSAVALLVGAALIARDKFWSR